MKANPRLHADAAEIAAFVGAIFRHAEPGSFVSLRAFDQFDRGKPPVKIQSVVLNGNFTDLVRAATSVADLAANGERAAVFAPPVCTFNNARTARTADVANGVALSLDLDTGDVAAARTRLEHLLGQVTVAMHSGGDFADENTGEVHEKTHLHWRLSEATTTPEDHAKLQDARWLAAVLVGADTTAAPSAHPLRWPGSWNTKARPRMANIVTMNDDAEIHLSEALEKLQDAVEAAGLGKAASSASKASGEPQASVNRISAAMALIPNADVTWDEWVRLGMATWRATGGSDEGRVIWTEWSSKSPKHDETECAAQWSHFAKSPPSRIGAGTLLYLAKQERLRHASEQQEQPGITVVNQPPSEPATEEDFDAAIDALVAEFNGQYMLVNEAGKAGILQPGFDPVLKRRYHYRLSTTDLRIFYLNRFIQVGVDEKLRPVFKQVAEIWLRHRNRLQYISGVTFDPTMTNARPGVLNLWQGYAVKPKPGNWSLMRGHIQNVVCASDSVWFNYLMGWMARMLQRPAEQGEVAVVMKGLEGTGKGTVAKALKTIIGHHALTISNPKHLVGNFNAHLRDTIFLFADEAFFAGDRAHVGVLKSLITEASLTIEAKYANAIEAPNFLHLMMASNEEWVVPASLEARRFFVLEVPDTKKGDHDYFAAIWEQMDAGGYAAMLHDLLEFDLTTFNVRAVPTTEGLQRQRKLSLPTTESWWMDCLARGYVFKSKLGLEAEFADWHEEAATELLFASYCDFASSRRERHLISRETLGRFFVHMGCKPKRLKDAVVSEHLTDETDFHGRTQRRARAVKHPRPPGYSLGDLNSARAGFTEATGLQVDWGDAEP